MKRIKKCGVILTICISMFLMAGCAKKKTNVDKNEPSVVPTVEATQEPVDTEASTEPTIVPETQSPDVTETQVPQDEMMDIDIYTISDDTLEPEAVTVQINKTDEITAKIIADAVSKVLMESGIEIKILDVDMKDGIVTVNLSSEYAPVTNVGAGVEVSILDCISMSLLDNAKDCNKVVFHVDGNAYASGHVELGFNEVYKWK